MRTTLIALILTGLGTMSAQATIFWDDEMESTIPGQFYYAPHFTAVVGNIDTPFMVHDTQTKFSGNASTRLYFHDGCQATAPSGAQCGGAIARQHPQTEDAWNRVYFRMGKDSNKGAPSGVGHNGCPGCSFIAYIAAYTKLIEDVGNPSPGSQNYPRLWWTFGAFSATGKTLILGVERTPTLANSRRIDSNFTFQDNIWYCVETHTKMNTGNLVNGTWVGNSDGIGEAWVNGVKVLTATDILYRNSGTDAGSKWTEQETIRQGGQGYIWWDRWAAGDQRIGCVGSPVPPPPADTQSPTVPAGLRAQAVSSSQINLTWNASTDNVGVSGYRIYRSGAQIGNATGTTYSNTGLSSSTAYSYTVSAYDAAGNASAQSATVSTTTSAGGNVMPPAKPKNLRTQ